jgi:hypothetical protein
MSIKKKDYQKAIKLLTQYERLTNKLNSSLPPSRIEALNRMRDDGTITVNDLPSILRREFPSQLLNNSLTEIRRNEQRNR